ncbi:putative Helicase ATP-binding domain-containing protein [Azospirillaceae bacterium]
MNLDFHDYKPITRPSTPSTGSGTAGTDDFMVQRADVTRIGAFWQLWRSPAAEAIKKFLYIQKEGEVFYAYRLKSLSETGPLYAPFNLNYQVRHVEKLLPYQPIAVSHIVQSILDNGAAADGSDTGLGKTYHALAACRELNLRPLIVCRKAGMAGWRRGCAYLSVTPYLIVNWEMMRTGKVHVNRHHPLIKKNKVILGAETNKPEYEWRPPRGTLLIFDEAHLGFNDESLNHAMWTASAGISSISLSATFADRPARLKGLFHVLRIMDPAAFDRWLLERGHFVNQYQETESLTALDDMKAINRILYPKYGYRVSYDDPEVKKYFPERVIQTEIVNLGEKLVGDQNRAYDEMMEKAKRFKELGKQAELMVADLRYRQYAELLKVRILVELVLDLLYLGKAVVVFVNFRETLRYLAEALHTRSMIFGDQERFGLSREQVIEDFQQGREKLVLCTSDAGGQSLDLHDVNGNGQRVSLICPTYNPITIQQVLGRTFRAGTKSTPIMKLVYAAGTIEEKVCETVNRKLDNIAALNEGDLMEPDLFNLGVRI